MGGAPCKSISLKLPLLLDVTPHQNFESPVALLIADHILEKKVSLIVFRQILPKLFSVAHIFSNKIMTNWRNLVGNKSLNIKQCPARLPLRILPLNHYGKHWGWGRIPANSQNLLISPTRKILLNKFTSSTIKSFVPSPSNSNLCLITLCNLHL